MMRSEHPSVVVLDLMMPVLSGWDVLQARELEDPLSALEIYRQVLDEAPTDEAAEALRLLRLRMQGLLFVGGTAATLAILVFNLWLAGRLLPPAGEGSIGGSLRSFVDRLNEAAESAQRGTAGRPAGPRHGPDQPRQYPQDSETLRGRAGQSGPRRVDHAARRHGAL